MSAYPWLTTLWAVPAIGALVVACLPAAAARAARQLALAVSLVPLGLTIAIIVRFDRHGPQYQFVESHSWIPSFGVDYSLGLDGIALVLVLLTVVLLPLLLLAGWRDAERHDEPAGSGEPGGSGAPRGSHAPGRRPQLYCALYLTVEAMVLLSFVSLDLLIFYVFFEAMLIPMYFLIGGFGAREQRAERSRAAVKFLLYNLVGGLVMLAAVIGLYVVTSRHGTGTFDIRELVDGLSSGRLSIDPGVARALFGGFMFAFAVKAPLWPLHTWLPGAAVEATPATGVLMMAVVDKVGTFGMLRYCLQLFPEASRYFAPLIITLAVIGILYGAVLAIGQRDLMRLIAYTSISHFGFIILGIFVMTSQGQAGSTLYMLNHGLSTAALFLVAGFLVRRRGSRLISAFGGMQKVAPVLAGTFLIAGLATLSLPGLSPFISEFLVFIGTYTRYPAAAVVAVVAIVLAALYVLWLYQRLMGGPIARGNEKIRDLIPREVAVLVPLVVLLVVLGFYPKPALDVIDPAVAQTLTTVGVHDPGPTAPTADPRVGAGEPR